MYLKDHFLKQMRSERGWLQMLLPAIGSALAMGGAQAIEAFSAQDINRKQISQADKQMAFQERMSSTAHQREVEDLRAAGLNPILSAKYGGASSPLGAQPVLHNPAAGVGAHALNSAQAVQTINMSKQMQRTEVEKQKLLNNEAQLQFQRTRKEAVEADWLNSPTGKKAMQMGYFVRPVSSAASVAGRIVGD